jgi:hypothetical protein
LIYAKITIIRMEFNSNDPNGTLEKWGFQTSPKGQIQSKQGPISPMFCRDVSRGVVNDFPKDQYLETSNQSRILKSIF